MPARFRLRSAHHGRESISRRSGGKKQRPARCLPPRSLALLLASIAVIATAVTLTGITLGGRSSASSTPPPLPCTWQMASAKCAAVQQASGALANPPPAPVKTGPGIDTAPAITCGASFFPADETRQLANAFGLISCFRLPAQNQWIVLGNGMSTTAAAATGTPGGPVVAVERCPAGDATCLDADGLHSFRNFLAARPPDPSARPLELQAVAGSSVLVLADAECGLVSFDLRSLRWYSGTASAVHALLTGASRLTPLPSGGVQTGSQALGTRPPAGPRAACRR